MKTKPCFLAFACAVVLAPPVRAQNVRLWSGNSGGAWLTPANWSGGNVFAGATDLASPLPGQGMPDDIMTCAPANRAGSIGINMSTVTGGNAGRGLTLGGIDWERTDAGACVIGNSSSTSGGILRLRGASLGGEPNTFVRIAGGGDLTISRASTGSPAAGQRMTLELSHAGGNFVVAPERTLTLSVSEITEATPATGITLKGGGTLLMAAPNRLSGPITVASGRLLASVPDALGRGAVTVANGSQLILAATTGTPVMIHGVGWPEAVGARGALVLQDATMIGPLSVSGPSRLGVPAGKAGNVAGALAGTADLEVNGDHPDMTGVLSLSGPAPEFRGTVRVTQGELRISSVPGPVGPVEVADGAVLSGEGSLGGNLDLGSSQGATLRVSTGSEPSLNVAGTVSVAGMLTVIPDPAARGTHKVMTAGQFAAALNQFTLPGGMSSYRPGTGFRFSDDALLLSLVPESIQWVAGESDEWSTAPQNWTGPGGRFHSADAAIFHDPPRDGNVVVTGPVYPGSVSIENQSGHYRFSGNGGILGTGSLTKTGNGTATLALTNQYTGGTTLRGGVLVLETAKALPGEGPLTIAGGTLSVRTPQGIAPSLTASLGAADSAGDQILELPAAESPDQAVLSCALSLHPASAGRAILRGPSSSANRHAASFTGSVALNGRSLWLEHAPDSPETTPLPWQMNGRITGAGELVIHGSAEETSIRLGYNGNDFTGNLILRRGTLQCGPVGTTTFNAIPNTASVLFGAGTRLILGSPEASGALADGGPDPASGLGPASISPATGSGNVTLTIGGGDASGTYYGGIADEGNRTLALIKTGTGTQTLRGPCRHTGSSTVSAGRLVIDQSWAAPITVSGGATLAGAGTSSSSITATSTGSGGANVAPGNPTGLLTATSANLSGGGNLRITIDDTAVPPNSHLQTAGNLNIAGTDLIVSGSPAAAVYLLASYGTLTGTFGTVSIPDSYRLVYGYDSGNGRTAVALVRENADVFPSWVASYGLTGASAEPEADPDRDGVPNALEFHFDGHPLAGDAPGLKAEAVPGALRIHYRRRDDAESFMAILETSADPATGPWIPLQPGTGGVAITITENGPDADTVEITIPISTTRQFFRLRVSGP